MNEQLGLIESLGHTDNALFGETMIEFSPAQVAALKDDCYELFEEVMQDGQTLFIIL